jgi:class 3 adenylate cyclase/tetratricopeptide (TPR) repeat protein
MTIKSLGVEKVLRSLGWSSGGRQGMKKDQTVEELMQLRAQIDQELTQRLSQTLCLMLADVVGSTAFYQQHGDVQGRLFIQRHHDTLTPLIVKRHGRVVKTIGDGIMAAFDAPTEALECALAVQQALWETRAQSPEDMPLQTKVSLHYGNALVETNDIYGDLVNMSARLIDMAAPDQILISQTVYEAVKAHTASPILPLTTRGWKEGERSIPVYEVLWQQLADTDSTSPQLRKFDSTFQACFYCGLREHQVTHCPSKQRAGHMHRLQQLGYLPLSDILQRFQQADLNNVTIEETHSSPICEAFYEVSLPYQLRFLTKVWLTTHEDWSSLERQPIPTTNPLVGTRLWMGLDCLRVARYEQATSLLHSTIESNPRDYKAYVVLGLVAMETAKPERALHHWRKGLALAKSTLQIAYMHLLMHRLYASNGKSLLASQELHKALNRHPHLHEAKYRQLALLVGGEREREVLSRLRTLIQDDRDVYLKVLLDPAFAPLRERLHALLSTLCQETRTEALQRVRDTTEHSDGWRAWYPRPEGDFMLIENALERLRQHLKSDSYFGYRDAVRESDALGPKMQRLLAQRKASLQRDYVATLDTVHTLLTKVALTQPLGPDPKLSGRLGSLKKDLARLRAFTSFHTASEFWQAWEALQTLQSAVHALTTTSTRWAGWRQKYPRLLSLALFGMGGSFLGGTALFALFGYLTYASGGRLPLDKLFLFLTGGAVGGLVVGGGLGLLLQWYRNRR